MKKIILALLISVGLYAGGNYYPCDKFQPYGYIGGGAIYAEFNKESDNLGFQGQAGYMLFGEDNFSFGVEGRIGYASVDILDATYYSGFAKVEYDKDKFGVYGLLGYGTADYSIKYDYLSISDSTSDFTWGAGLKYDLKNFSIFIDYTVLPDYEVGTDTIDSDIVTLGVNYKFGGF